MNQEEIINRENTIYKTIEDVPEDDFIRELVRGEEDEDLEEFEEDPEEVGLDL